MAMNTELLNEGYAYCGKLWANGIDASPIANQLTNWAKSGFGGQSAATLTATTTQQQGTSASRKRTTAKTATKPGDFTAAVHAGALSLGGTITVDRIAAWRCG